MPSRRQIGFMILFAGFVAFAFFAVVVGVMPQQASLKLAQWILRARFPDVRFVSTTQLAGWLSDTNHAGDAQGSPLALAAGDGLQLLVVAIGLGSPLPLIPTPRRPANYPVRPGQIRLARRPDTSRHLEDTAGSGQTPAIMRFLSTPA